jgi:acetyl-CoA/propionyl-CoA carboxylase biotin carboxyl carrier protein
MVVHQSGLAGDATLGSTDHPQPETSCAHPSRVTVIRVSAAEGDVVAAGQVICVVEAMKMENDLTAQRAGVIDSLSVDVGKRCRDRCGDRYNR